MSHKGTKPYHTLTSHQRMHVCAYGLIGGNGNTEMVWEGQNFANVAQTENQLWTLTQLVYTPKEIIICTQSHYLFCHWKAKIRPMWPQNKPILHIYTINVHTKFDLECVDTFILGNGRKSPFSDILWQLEGKNSATSSKSESIQNTHPIRVHARKWSENTNFNHFVATRGQTLSQRGPKVSQFWTLTQYVYTPNLNWIAWIRLKIMVGNHHF